MVYKHILEITKFFSRIMGMYSHCVDRILVKIKKTQVDSKHSYRKETDYLQIDTRVEHRTHSLVACRIYTITNDHTFCWDCTIYKMTEL